MSFDSSRSSRRATWSLARRLGGWARRHSRLLIRTFWIISIAAVGSAIAVQLVRSWQDVQSYSWELQPAGLALGFGVYSVLWALTARVWASIIGRLSGKPGTLIHMRLWCLTNLANRLPTPVPFLAARSESYASLGVQRGTTLTATGLEVALTIAGAAIVGLATLPFGPYRDAIAPYWPAVGIPLAAIALLVTRPNWLLGATDRLLRRLGRPPLGHRLDAREVQRWLAVFVLLWALTGVLRYFLATAIYPVPLDRLLFMTNVFAVAGLVSWIGQFLLMIPVLGLQEMTVVYLLSFALPLPVSVAIAVMTRAAVLLFELGWAGAFALLTRGPARAAQHDSADGEGP